MLIGAVVSPFALGIQSLHENEKPAKCSGTVEPRRTTTSLIRPLFSPPN